MFEVHVTQIWMANICHKIIYIIVCKIQKSKLGSKLILSTKDPIIYNE